MAKIPDDELTQVSFPDCGITSFVFSCSELKCEFDGVHTDRLGLVESPVLLSISNWETVTIKCFDASGQNHVDLEVKNSGELREFCECSISPNSASFSGFEKATGSVAAIHF